MSNKYQNCALFVDGNGKYCCQKKVFTVGKYPVSVTNANCDPVELILYPTGDTDEVAIPSGVIAAPGTTIVSMPGKYELPCPEGLDGEVAPEDPLLQKALCCCEIKTSLDPLILQKLCELVEQGGGDSSTLTALLEKLCELFGSEDGSAIEKLCAIVEALVGPEGSAIEKLCAILATAENLLIANNTWCAADAVFQAAMLECMAVLKANTAAITGIETSLGQIGCTEDEEGNITGSVLVCKVSDTTTDPVTDTIKVWWFGLNGTVIEDYTGPYVACTNLQALANLLQKICDKLENLSQVSILECCDVPAGAVDYDRYCRSIGDLLDFTPDEGETCTANFTIDGVSVALPDGAYTEQDSLDALNGSGMGGIWTIHIAQDGSKLLCSSLPVGMCFNRRCFAGGGVLIGEFTRVCTITSLVPAGEVVCETFLRTYDKNSFPIAQSLADIQSTNQEILGCLQADKGPQCTEQTFGPLSDCIFSDDPDAEIVTAANNVYVDIKVCDGIPEEPFIYTLAGAEKELYELQGELANPDKTLFEPELECPDVSYEAATIQRKLNILDNSLWDNAPAIHIGVGDFPATDIEVTWTDGSTSVFNWPGGTGLYGGFRAWLLEESGCIVANVLANWPRFPTNLPWGLTDEDVPRECLFARGWSLMCCVGSKCIDTATVVASDNADWVGASKTACSYDGPLETVYVGHVGCNIIYKDCEGNLIELPKGCCPLPDSGAELLQKQCDANEMASDALIKDCLLFDELTNCADETPLAETLNKEAGELCLEGDVVSQYTAGATISLKDAAGNVCGSATVAADPVPRIKRLEGEGDAETLVGTIVYIEECELAEGKTPVQIKTAKPVLQVTAGAVKAVVKQISILQAKTLVKAQAIKTPVKEPITER